jgi:two-component system nitrogen regulation sensor histidine kinase NtrY
MMSIKRKAYIVGLLTSILLWCAAWLYFQHEEAKYKPAALAQSIQQNLQQQQDEVQAMLANQSLMHALWQNQLNDQDFDWLLHRAYSLKLYQHDSLIYWNRNTGLGTDSFQESHWTTIIEPNRTAYLYRTIPHPTDTSIRLCCSIPIYTHYGLHNEYLKSGFVASTHISNLSTISVHEIPEAFPIYSTAHKLLFYLKVVAQDTLPFKPDAPLLLLIIFATLCSVATLHFIAVMMGKVKGWFSGFVFLLLLLIGGRWLLYRYGLPFNLDSLELFSPQIFASNSFLPSIGHLFIHILCIYWLVGYLHVQGKRIDRLHCSLSNPIKCWLLFCLTTICLVAFSLYLQGIIRSLVFDSDISFDTNTFNAADSFTLLAIIMIGVLARVYLLSVQLADVIKSKTIPNSKWRYGAIIVLSCLLVLFFKFIVIDKGVIAADAYQEIALDFMTVISLVAYSYLSSNTKIQSYFRNSGLFTLIFIGVYFSILFSVFFKFYIDKKEQQITRVAFAEKLSRKQDTKLELSFDAVSDTLLRDTFLIHTLKKNRPIRQHDLYQKLSLLPSDLFSDQYHINAYLFAGNQQPLVYQQTERYQDLCQLQRMSMPTLSAALFFRLDSTEQSFYLVHLHFVDSVHTQKPLGDLFIVFQLKANSTHYAYPSLLKKISQEDRKSDLKYNYAIYAHQKLISQSGATDFEYTIPAMPKGLNYYYQQKGALSRLCYKANDNVVYVVVYQNNFFVGVLTIFSFLFAVFLVISSLENWFRLLLSAWIKGGRLHRMYHSSMSVRLKYFVLGFTAVSFFVIGLSTVIFLSERYQSTSKDNIEHTTQNLAEAIHDYLTYHKTVDSSRDLHISDDVAFFLTNIAQQQKIELNLYDVHGRLLFSNQEALYQKGVFNKFIAPSALRALQHKKTTIYLQVESLGSLLYTASYAPVYAADNQLVAYVNVPSFYTNEQLDIQIVSLITTLVNIYTVLILISSIITFIFINSLTRSLRLVANSLKNVNLKKNELIVWPYKDEIGLLVEEYNKMVATVEKNARSLVLDERQNAWREMAQQVAHEIKNPLTPMKLNIQYLQQAINSNHPDIINLTKRVSSSIIEQIDNLNYIASEFSNFAKMPENKTERIDLKSMLERIILLFAGNHNLRITHSFPEESVVVFADKSQMLRIFTNIVQNAVESLATEERPGHVDIQLLLHADSVTIQVADNGSGIPEEVKAKIFDPYFTTKSSGTGLGLAMSKKIIELWGGTIRFESSLGEGTTFFLTVPLGH